MVDLRLRRRLVDQRQDALAHIGAQQVVEVLDGAGAALGASALDRVPGRRDVVDFVQHPQQAVDPIEDAVETLFEGPFQHAVVGRRGLGEQVVAERQHIAVDGRLPHQKVLDLGPRDRQLGMVAPQALERRDDLVAQEAVAGAEAVDEGVHGRLARHEGQDARDVAAHPVVLVGVLQRVAQRRDDLLAARDERLPRRVPQHAVAQPGEERRQEQPVGGAEGAGGADRLQRDVDVVVVQQRHQQDAEARVVDPGQRPRRLHPAFDRGVPRVVDEPAERRFGALHVRRLGRAGQRGGRRHHDARLGDVQMIGHDGRGVAMVEDGKGHERGRAHLDVVVARHPLHGALPALGHAGAPGGQRPQCPHADRPRLVAQQQRRDEMRLVHRLEHLDGVQHGRLVGVRQLLHERLDGGRLGGRRHDRVRRDRLGIDALPERAQVLLPRPDRHRDPEPGDGERGVAQEAPVQPEAPRLNEHEQHQGRHRLGEAVHRDVDERLHAVPQLGRQREEQHLPRRLVERVAQGRAQDPRPGHRPERAGAQDDGGAGAEAERQEEQRETDADRPVDAADEGHLHDEPRDRQVGGDLGQERRDGGAAPPAHLVGRHAELLVDDGRAGRRESDREGQDAQRARLGHETDRFLPPDPALVGIERGVVHVVSAEHQHHDARAPREDQRTHQEELLQADRLDDGRGDGGADGAAEAGAAADEAEEPLRLPRVEDVVRQRPELADQQDAEDQAEEVEADRRPDRAGSEQRPERDEDHHDGGLRHRHHVLARDAADRVRVEVHDDADGDAGGEQHVGQVVGPEILDELRAGDRLDDVVGRHRQERVGEHQQGRCRLLAPDGRDGAQQAREEGPHPVGGKVTGPRRPRGP